MTCNDSSIERKWGRVKESAVTTAMKNFSRFCRFGPSTSELVIISAGNSVVFTLPTIASGQGANAQEFSDWYQFGKRDSK